MKKSLLSLLLLITLVLAGCTSNSNSADMSGYDLLTVEDHNFITGNPSDIMLSIENLEPGIYYFGYASCPWCRELIPELQEVVSEKNLNVTVVDISNQSEWTLALNQRLEAFATRFDSETQYTGVPYVIFIGPDEQARAHVGTLSSHDARSRMMTDNERTYLRRLLRDAIEAVGLE